MMQNEINAKIVEFLDGFYANIKNRNLDSFEVKKLRSCSAKVYVSDDYFVLKSYETVIAVIDRKTNICYDFLRLAYHFTMTSAQHVSKFIHDYTPYPWNSKRYTWRDLEKVK